MTEFFINKLLAVALLFTTSDPATPDTKRFEYYSRLHDSGYRLRH